MANFDEQWLYSSDGKTTTWHPIFRPVEPLLDFLDDRQEDTIDWVQESETRSAAYKLLRELEAEHFQLITSQISIGLGVLGSPVESVQKSSERLAASQQKSLELGDELRKLLLEGHIPERHRGEGPIIDIELEN